MAKYGETSSSEKQRVRQLEDENQRLKHLTANLSLNRETLKVVLEKTSGARMPLGAVSWLLALYRVSQRPPCRLIKMAESSYRHWQAG